MIKKTAEKCFYTLHETWHCLSFLRILIFDVGLSLADTLTDFLQAYAITLSDWRWREERLRMDAGVTS